MAMTALQISEEWSNNTNNNAETILGKSDILEHS